MRERAVGSVGELEARGAGRGPLRPRGLLLDVDEPRSPEGSRGRPRGGDGGRIEGDRLSMVSSFAKGTYIHTLSLLRKFAKYKFQLIAGIIYV